MTTVALILTMAACVYAVRLSGFMLGQVTIPPGWELALAYVPIATLTAVVTASLAGRNDQMPYGIVAAASAAAIARLTRRAWASIVGGMVIYWVLLFIG